MIKVLVPRGALVSGPRRRTVITWSAAVATRLTAHEKGEPRRTRAR